jgi:hypothetical protein
MEPTLKAPGAKRLQLENDESLSNFAFNFNLRRCTVVAAEREDREEREQSRNKICEVIGVGRRRLAPSKPWHHQNLC